MNHHYQDIIERISEPPVWWDENAVPRYCAFTPDATADIYADEACLLEVSCQSCGTLFAVALTNSLTHGRPTPMRDRLDEVEYGDPPNTGCCAAGPTMTSVPLRVVELWRRDQSYEWVRCSELERPVHCEWAEAPAGDGET